MARKGHTLRKLRFSLFQVWLNPRRSSAAEQAAYQRNHEQHDEDEEQYFRNAGCGTGDTAKTEYSGNQRDDEKRKRPSEHAQLLVLPVFRTFAVVC
jgi:hypothetical protein